MVKRPRYPMPEFVRVALRAQGLTQAYQNRPAYQRNDYVGWITRAKLPQTKRRRLLQMLEELRGGHTYMKMKWRPRGGRSRAESRR
jgi:uncharacterized protein YdeI (YjbR/CyaY-like superfamily)